MTFKSYVSDAGSPRYEDNEAWFAGLDRWAQMHCPSYVGYTVTDVSDNSYLWDEVACYEFNNQQDLLAFELKWN